MDNRWQDRSLVWPVLLILAGVVLLLNNSGQLEFGLLELIFRSWPAILLAFGIELLIPRRSAWSYSLTLVLVLAVFAGSYLLLDTIDARAGSGGGFEEPLAGGTEAILVLDPIIGEVHLSSGAPGRTLLAGTLPDSDSERISIQRTRRGDRTVLEVSRDFDPGGWIVFPFLQERWNLSASSSVPLEVEAELAVGLMDLDLSDLEVGRVDASIGAGEIQVVLPNLTSEVSVDGGVGLLRIVVPAEADVRVIISRGLSALDLPDDYSYTDGVARSPGAGGGAADIQLRVNLGVGLISIVED